MPVRLSPYLGFRDNARAAMEFYQSVLGGKLDISTFSDFQASEDPADADKVMHSQLELDNGMTLMASDAPSGTEYSGGGSHSVALFGDDEAEMRGYWDKLSDGGTVVMPYDKAPWGDTFGMVVDTFGVTWQLNAAGPQQ